MGMKPIRVTFDDALLERLDRHPAVRERGRSAVLREATAEFLAREDAEEIDRRCVSLPPGDGRTPSPPFPFPGRGLLPWRRGWRRRPRAAQPRRCARGTVAVEPGVSDEVVAKLRRRGHRVVRAEGGMGGYQAILIPPRDGMLNGGTDVCKDGQVVAC